MAELNARIIAKASATSGEAPLAGDLEVAELAVNTADGKFFTKHTDGTVKEISGSGGGKDRIQDMDDYSNNSLPGQNPVTRTVENATTPSEGGVGINQIGSGITNWAFKPEPVTGSDVLAYLRNDASYPIDVSINGVVVNVTTASYTTGGDRKINLTHPALTDVSQIPGTEWTLSLPDSYVPLVDGDVLQWNDFDQKFKPAQSKDRIQDMDDYEPNTPPANKVWSNVVVGSSGNAVIADRCVLHSSGTIIYFNYSLGGEDFESDVLALDGQTVDLTLDGINITTTLSYLSASNGQYAYFNSSASLSSMVTAVQGDPNLQMSVDNPGWAIGSSPLSDGEILQWNDARQKFKPAQLPADADTKRIQDMDDYGLERVDAQISWNYSSAGTSNPATGIASNWSGINWAFSTIDADGNDREATLYAMDIDERPTNVYINNVIVYAGTSDFWQNKTSNRITCGFGDDSWKSALVDGDLLTLEVPEWSSGFTPLSQGDILQWDDFEQKFKPAQLPAGGGGAVDSVNGQTGVVEIGVEHLDDFEYKKSFSGNIFTGSPSGVSNGTLSGDGPFTNFPPSFQRCTISKFNQDGSTNLVVADIVAKTPSDRNSITNANLVDILVEVDGVQYPLSVYCGADFGTYIQMEAQPGQGVNPSVLTTNPAWWPFGSAFNSSANEAFIAPNTPVDVPLVDGDALVYNATTQKWNPQQPSGGGISRIQDASDFDYQRAFLVPFYRSTSDGSGDVADTYLYNDGSKILYLSYVAADSVDQQAELEAQFVAGGSLFYRYDETSEWTELGVTSVGTYRQSFYVVFDGVGLTGSYGNGVYVTSSDPGLAAPIPLAEGDILQWNNNDQEFKPAQLSTGGGAVDSVNGETGNVSLGIQDMDDFELPTTPPVSYSYPNYQGGGNAPEAAGYFRTYFSSGVHTLQVHNEDENGSNVRAGFLLLPSPGTIWLSSDGINFSEEPYETLATGSDVVNFQRTTNWDESSPLFLSLSDPGSPADIPLAEGDILQWNDADQKFNPAQLPAIPVDSVNGEAGVVSLGIQDMDDFQLTFDYGATSVTLLGPPSPAPTVEDDWYVGPNANNFFAFFNNGLVQALIDNQSVGDTLEFVTEGGYVHSAVLSQGPTFNSAESNYVSFVGYPWPTQIMAAQTNNEGITVREPADSGASVPLADGDILQWVAGTQAFEPGRRGFVDSVNDQTGVVSLGIQDMDDVRLLPSGGPRLIYNTGHDGTEPPVGTFNAYAADPTYIVINPVDADGVDWYSSWIDPAVFDTGTAFSVKVNGVLQEGITVGAVGINNSQRILFQPQGWITYDNLEDGDEVEFLIPTFPGDRAPLTAGDILQWNDTSQRFMPAQLSAVIDKATLQSVVAASSDFADFQSRIAAL